jgi:hypothetical protein
VRYVIYMYVYIYIYVVSRLRVNVIHILVNKGIVHQVGN